MILRALFFRNSEEFGQKGILGQSPSISVPLLFLGLCSQIITYQGSNNLRYLPALLPEEKIIPGQEWYGPRQAGKV